MEMKGVPNTTEQVYSDDLKMKDALPIHFSKYHFENGGYDLKWFRVKFGPLYLPFPNTAARIKAVKIHDLHHILTGYSAQLRGEAEISGWEIASGCGTYAVAWMLNSLTFFYGLLFCPKALWSAFMRGRRCHTNLYYHVVYNDELLNRTVGELRQTIGLYGERKNRFSDYLLFGGYSLMLLALTGLALWLVCFLFGI